MAPDPGQARLRFAARAVLGIGLAVVLCALAGRSMPATITGGLAALLALFTVTDATVRGQAVTTALLPAVGLPVLALAAVLHDLPVARDLAFLAVVGAGAYARRWGPRGHSLGVFAFMTFFAAQFLHTVPGQLPELYAAVLLSLAASSTVRFGLWCYERRRPVPVAAVAPPTGGWGLARITTRQAIQATAGAGIALVVGQALSDQRWYWAVGATWWVFVNTTSRGETLIRGFRRFLGTVIGIVLGLVVALPLHGEPVATAVIVTVAVFGIFYSAAVSYTWMMLAVTVLASALYGLLGLLDPALLALRVTETAVGALGAVLAVLLVLPVTTHSVTDAWVERALRCVHACTAEAAARLAGSPTADPARRVAELEQILARVRQSLAPLVHPLSPLRARKGRARHILELLDDCAREVRGLTSVAADPEASHDARLVTACWRVEAAVETLTTPPADERPRRAGEPVAAPQAVALALARFDGVEAAVKTLTTPSTDGLPRRAEESVAAPHTAAPEPARLHGVEAAVETLTTPPADGPPRRAEGAAAPLHSAARELARLHGVEAAIGTFTTPPVDGRPRREGETVAASHAVAPVLARFHGVEPAVETLTTSLADGLPRRAEESVAAPHTAAPEPARLHGVEAAVETLTTPPADGLPRRAEESVAAPHTAAPEPARLHGVEVAVETLTTSLADGLPRRAEESVAAPHTAAPEPARLHGVEVAVETLTDGPPRHAGKTLAPPHSAAPHEPVLAHLHALEQALLELAGPLRGARRAPNGAWGGVGRAWLV